MQGKSLWEANSWGELTLPNAPSARAYFGMAWASDGFYLHAGISSGSASSQELEYTANLPFSIVLCLYEAVWTTFTSSGSGTPELPRLGSGMVLGCLDSTERAVGYESGESRTCFSRSDNCI